VEAVTRPPATPSTHDTAHQQAQDLLARLTLDEKLAMLDGDTGFWEGIRETVRGDAYHRRSWPAGQVPRLGIRGLHFVDGPRGVVLDGGATTFPAPIGRGASWDADLERRVGEAIAREARSFGANLWGGVCVNLLRHPGWGRAQETYGEDPVHLAVMGSAAVTGAQRHLVACVKHFALNSIENARFRVDVTASPRVLHEVYLPHFRACVEAGAGAVMSAYNSVNGQWCGQNEMLLTDILKRRWGFTGFVLTDFVFGLRDAGTAVRAGQDLEMPFRLLLAADLAGLVAAGQVPLQRVDDAVLRLLGAQLAVPGDDPPPEVRGCAEHVGLAREAATESIVLLANRDCALPLTDVGSIAVLGRLAVVPNLGDHGSSDTRPAHVVTPLAGLAAAVGDGVRVRYGSGDDQQAAAVLAAQVDAAVVVVGLDWRDEGEHIETADLDWLARRLPAPGPFQRLRLARVWDGLSGLLARLLGHGPGLPDFHAGDRTMLRLDPRDEALVRTVAAANPRTVVVLMGGGALVTEAWRHQVPAIVLLGYPGQEGGHALADVLLGRVSPSGRLPFTMPVEHGHLPPFDPTARQVTYDLWHGYRLLARDGNTAAFPFGHGLSYTTFETSELRATLEQVDGVPAAVRLTATVTNTGACDGAEVVQVYAEPPAWRGPGVGPQRPARWLAGFTRVPLAAGECAQVSVEVPMHRLAWFDEASDAFTVQPGGHVLRVGRDVEDSTGAAVVVDLPEQRLEG
jgi:beta-glucosidase